MLDQRFNTSQTLLGMGHLTPFVYLIYLGFNLVKYNRNNNFMELLLQNNIWFEMYINLFPVTVGSGKDPPKLCPYR